jgi:tetratricopeptide (TPR) repeat protein
MIKEMAGRWRRALRAGCILLAVGAALLASAAVNAHANGSSYLRIQVDDDTDRLLATWDIAAADLELPLELDDDGDGKLSAAEIELRHGAISQFAVQRLHIERGGADCRLSTGAISTRMREEPYLSLRLTAVCPSSGALHVASSLFFGSTGYSTLLDVQTSAGRFPAMLSAAAPGWIEPPSESTLDSVLLFAREGVWHVLIGYDHIAFLFLLLLLRWNAAERTFLAARDAELASNRFRRAQLATMAGNAALADGRADAALIALALAASDAAAADDAALRSIVETDRARALVAQGSQGEAEAVLAAARTLDAQNALAWLLSATLARRLGKLDEAQAFIETAAALSPDYPEVGLEAGVIAMLQGRREAAEASWRSVVAVESGSEAAATARGYLAQLAELAAEAEAE